jgi:hypothetical protein
MKDIDRALENLKDTADKHLFKEWTFDAHKFDPGKVVRLEPSRRRKPFVASLAAVAVLVIAISTGVRLLAPGNREAAPPMDMAAKRAEGGERASITSEGAGQDSPANPQTTLLAPAPTSTLDVAAGPKTVEDLASAADTIVVAQVVGANSATGFTALAPVAQPEEKTYQVQVERWLKGEGESTANVAVFHDSSLQYFEDASTPLTEGDRYVIFLKKGEDGVLREVFVPWQLQLVDGRVVLVGEPNVIPAEVTKNFSGLTEADLIRLLKPGK